MAKRKTPTAKDPPEPTYAEAFKAWLIENAAFGTGRLAEVCGLSEAYFTKSAKRALGRTLSDEKRAQGLGRNSVAAGTPSKPPARPATPRTEAAKAEGDHIDLRRSKEGLSATIILQTPQGKDLEFPEALANPKFKRVMEASAIDLDEFEISRFKANSWDVTLNLDGTPETRTNHQFLVEWRRKAPSPLLIAMERLVKRVEPAPPRKLRRRKASGRMVELSLYDLHFGLLAWRAETGEDYDVHIASRIMENAVSQMIERTGDLRPDYFLVPIGNDLFHVNDPSNTTPSGGNRLDVDTRLAYIIETTEMAMESMTERLAEIAPVRLFWIPGNHDPQTSYHLLRTLNARYREDARVDVDTSPMPRKYRAYGKNLIGFGHGCDISKAQEKLLPGIMASEAADMWQPGQYREFHRGHLHKKSELCFLGAETYGSVVVRTIPSLCGTDYWHFQHGFVETSKTAQYFVWSHDYGLESVSDVHVDARLYHKGKA